MEFYMKLPRNKKEMTIFIAIISVISICIIAPLITCFEIGFNITVWGEAMRVVPFIWISVIIVVLLTHKPADWLTGKIIKKEETDFVLHKIGFFDMWCRRPDSNRHAVASGGF